MPIFFMLLDLFMGRFVRSPGILVVRAPSLNFLLDYYLNCLGIYRWIVRNMQVVPEQ